MTRFTALLAAAALVATPALAQVSSEAPPEDAAPPTEASLEAAASVASVASEAPAAEVAAPVAEPAPAPAPVAAVAADPNVYQVLRAGDRDMSCDALIGETNSLNAYILAEQQKAQKKGTGSKIARGAGGAATATGLKTAGRFGLSRMAGSFGPMGAIVALAATDAVADGAGAAIANGGGAPAQPQMMPEQQRMNHLLGLYREKGC